MRFCVLTVSDSSYNDNGLDKSGPELIRLLTSSPKLAEKDGGVEIVDQSILPDEREKIAGYLRSNLGRADCILTTGGTGLAKRDVTPEATRDVIERDCPGIVVAIVSRGLQITPLAALTRQTAGIAGRCLIVNLPGSPKAVAEGFHALESIIPHAVAILREETDEVARTHKEM